MAANVLGLETATAALILACISAAISLTSLAWQLTLYRLSGARLDVRLRPTVLSVQGHILRGPERGWPTKEPPLDRVRLEDGFVDLAEIRVVNIGRTPVTVSDITLDFGWSKRPGWRHTVGRTPVPVFEGVGSSGAHRLEVGASVTMYVDHLPLLDNVRQARPKVRAVRASAQGAGKRPTRSRWRRRWRLCGARSVSWPNPPKVSTEIETFRKVFRVVYPRDISKLYETWISVGGLYVRGDEKPTAMAIAEELAAALDQETPDMDMLLAAHEIERTYEGPESYKRLLEADPLRDEAADEDPESKAVAEKDGTLPGEQPE